MSRSPGSSSRRDRPLGDRRGGPAARRARNRASTPRDESASRTWTCRSRTASRTFVGIRRSRSSRGDGCCGGADGPSRWAAAAQSTRKGGVCATGAPLIAIPTTYSGAEWTGYFGMRDEARGAKTGGSGANTVAIVYEPALTLDLPLAETVGTALNALLIARKRSTAGLRGRDRRSCPDRGSAPEVAANGRDSTLERGCSRARCTPGGRSRSGDFSPMRWHRRSEGGTALRTAPSTRFARPALRFNEPVVPEAVAALAAAMASATPGSCRGARAPRRLAPPRPRNSEDELGAVAVEVAQRPGARSNPRPVSRGDRDAPSLDLVIR